jgi:hypothetical protein
MPSLKDLIASKLKSGSVMSDSDKQAKLSALSSYSDSVNSSRADQLKQALSKDKQSKSASSSDSSSSSDPTDPDQDGDGISMLKASVVGSSPDDVAAGLDKAKSVVSQLTGMSDDASSSDKVPGGAPAQIDDSLGLNDLLQLKQAIEAKILAKGGSISKPSSQDDDSSTSSYKY